MQFSKFLEKNLDHYSLYKLANKTGISLNQLVNYRDGKSDPTLKKADRICKALGVKLVLGE